MCAFKWSLIFQMVRNLPTVLEIRVWSLGQEDHLEKGMATHSSILAWRIPWTEEPGGLLSMGSQRVGHDWATSLSLFNITCRASLLAQMVKNLPAMPETLVWSLGQEDPLEEGKVTHSSILAWRIPWIEEPSGLQYMALRRVRHD